MSSNITSNLSDEYLATKAQELGPRNWNEDVLTQRYWELCGIIAHQFPIPGLDSSDRQTVALIGLLKAVRNWKPGKGASFKTYAKRLIGRHLVDAYRTQTDAGEIPKRLVKSMEEALGGGAGEADLTFEDIIADDGNLAQDTEVAAQAAEALAAVKAAQDQALQSLAGGDGSAADSRLAESLLVWARHEVANGRMLLPIYARLTDWLSSPGQWSLFGPTPGLPAVVDEDQALARAVMAEYAALQYLILMDTAEGWQVAELADARGIAPEVVSSMLAAVRESGAQLPMAA